MAVTQAGNEKDHVPGKVNLGKPVQAPPGAGDMVLTTLAALETTKTTKVEKKDSRRYLSLDQALVEVIKVDGNHSYLRLRHDDGGSTNIRVWNKRFPASPGPFIASVKGVLECHEKYGWQISVDARSGKGSVTRHNCAGHLGCNGAVLTAAVSETSVVKAQVGMCRYGNYGSVGLTDEFGTAVNGGVPATGAVLECDCPLTGSAKPVWTGMRNLADLTRRLDDSDVVYGYVDKVAIASGGSDETGYTLTDNTGTLQVVKITVNKTGATWKWQKKKKFRATPRRWYIAASTKFGGKTAFHAHSDKV